MSSPFSIFRKNQRVWMALLVVVAMVSFILIPLFTTVGQQGNLVDNAVAVRWKGGSISRQELAALAASYQRSHQFLVRLASEVVSLGGRPSVPGFSVEGNQIQIGFDEPTDAVAVIRTRLLAEEARRHGVVVDDQTVDLYIQGLTNSRITVERYKELMKETAGADLSRFQLYRYIKDEICKQLMLQMQAASFGYNGAPLVTPANNWENFRKFEQRAKIEAYPISTNTFLDQVQGEPNDRELRDIYEAGKNRFANNKLSAEFGFAQRYAADFEYVRGSLDQYLEAEKKNVTEDQIKAEYDRRVTAGQFRVPDTTGALVPTAPSAPDKSTQPAEATPQTPAPESTIQTPPAGENPANPPAAGTTVPSGQEPTAPATPEQTPSATPEAGGQAPANEQSAPVGGGSDAPRNPLRFIAFQENAPAGDAQQPASTQTAPAGESQPAATPSASSDPKTTDSAPAPETTPAPLTTPVAPPLTGTAPGVAAPAGVGATPQVSPPMRTKSLDEVREEIVQSIVYAPAQTKLQTALQGAMQKMQTYQQELQYYLDAERSKFDKVEKPKPLDLAKVADEFGLQYGRTGMLNQLTASDTEIGKSFFQNQRTFQPLQFTQVMFTKQVATFAPYTFDSFGPNASLSSYVTWKVEEKSEYIATFEQARSEVVAAWKETKARELAKAKADDIASKLKAQGDWNTVLTETEQAVIQRPTPFTWLQQPSFMTRSIDTSIVEGIGEVDDDFMKQAFNAKDGEFIVASSINKDRYFVIKKIELQPSDSDVLAKYAANTLSPATQVLASAQMQTLQAAWMSRFQEELELDVSGLNNQAE